MKGLAHGAEGFHLAPSSGSLSSHADGQQLGTTSQQHAVALWTATPSLDVQLVCTVVEGGGGCLWH